jgi:hypothetical protein
MRQSFVAEERVMAQYMAARRKARQAEMAQSFAMGASMMAQASAPMTPVQAMQTTMSTMMATAQLAENQAQAARDLQAILSAYHGAVVDTTAAHQSMVVDLFGEEEAIDARTLAELRAKMRARYLARVRKLDLQR